MVFCSRVFFFLFLPVVLAAYYLLPRSCRNALLLAASLFFYLWGEKTYIYVLLASIARPRPGTIYNVCDDEPAAPEAVIAHAASLLGLPAPPLVPFEAAALSPMARSFWDDNKRVSNALIKSELGVALRYPNYRAGLAAILAAGG